MTAFKFILGMTATACLLASPFARAQEYFTDFDAYTPNATLSFNETFPGSGRFWDNTDDAMGNPFLGYPDAVGLLSGNNWGLIGGGAGAGFATIPNPTVFPDLGVDPFVGGFVGFALDFFITGPTDDVFDSFSIVFTGAGQTAILFEPDAGDPTRLGIFWFDDTGARQGQGGDPAEAFGFILYNGLYKIQALVETGIGGVDDTFTVSIVGTNSVTFGGNLDNGSAKGIQTVGIQWNIAGADPTDDHGDNTMWFDNYSVVPEPSSLVLILAAAGLAGLRRRR